MKKQVLTIEEQRMLQKLNLTQLYFLKRIKNDKDAETFKQIVNMLIDIEKNIFFGENEISRDDLFAKHAYARGGIGKLTTLFRIIQGSEAELDRREAERKKKKDEKET